MRTLSMIAVLSACACQQGRDAEPTKPVSPTNATVEVAAQPASPQPATANVPAAESAPRLTRNADGTIRLEVVDKWGARFDSTYEDVSYLRRALPVVSRGLTAEQTAELERALGTLH